MSLPVISGGDIRPARFIKLSTAADHTVLEADANERVFGVSIDAAQDAPIPSADGDAADAGDFFRYLGPEEEATLELADTVVRGDLLVSDADGKGEPYDDAATTVQWIGAEAMESGAAGEKIKVIVKNFPIRPALV